MKKYYTALLFLVLSFASAAKPHAIAIRGTTDHSRSYLTNTADSAETPDEFYEGRFAK